MLLPERYGHLLHDLLHVSWLCQLSCRVGHARQAEQCIYCTPGIPWQHGMLSAAPSTETLLLVPCYGMGVVLIRIAAP